MTNRSILLLAVALAAIAGVWLALGRGDAPRPEFEGPFAEQEATDGPSGPVNTARADLTAPEVGRRTAVAGETDARAGRAGADEPRPSLAVTGRVVDPAGGPVAGARVELFARRDPSLFFGDGNRPRPESFGDMREMFRAEVAAAAATTDASGHYAIDGRAFTASILELAVTHQDFAPELVRQNWRLEEGRQLAVEDVVLDGGAVVRGRVVGPDGNAVPGAQVRVQSLEAFEGGPRGGRGGPPGMRRMMAAGAPDDDPTRLLGAVTETDASGHFAFDRVPSGELIVRAEEPGYVPGEATDLQAADGATVEVGDVRLLAGAQVTGRVIDTKGEPVADAEVTGSASREGGGERRPRRNGDEEGDGRAMARRLMRYRQSVRTDEQGRFDLDMVPAGPLEVSVEHPAYVDLEVDPIEPVPGQQLELRVQERPTLAGTVLDRHTGEPVELFGIRARRVGGDFDPADWDGGGRGDRQNQDPERQAEIQARIDEWRAERERQQAYREQRIGGSGLTPGRAPDPTPHENGRFLLEDLQPGEFVLDIDAPGYVRIAAGRFEVSADSTNADVVVRLERGTTVRGRVLDASSREPVADARISLELPPLDGDAGGERRGGMFGGWRGGPGRDRVAEVRTADDGSYEFPPLRPGTFVLTIEARDYPDQHDAAFVVQASPSEQKADFALDPGARVFGYVLDHEPGDRLRLSFRHLDSDERRTVAVDPETGSYEILGLPAGGYYIQVQQRGGEGENGWQSRFAGEIAARSATEPDVFVSRGGEVRHDVGVASLELGAVRGRVYRNGSAGDGLEVRLAAVDDGTATTDDGGRRGRRGLSRLLSAEVSADDGSFSIDSVPPGQYLLEVHARGGRGGGPRRAGPGFGTGALYSEPVSVARGGAPIERMIEVVTGALHMKVTDPDGQPITRARLSIALVSELAQPDDPSTWQNADSLQRFGLRNGELEANDIQPGVYRFVIESREFAPKLGDVVVAARTAPTAPLVVVVEPQQSPADDEGR